MLRRGFNTAKTFSCISSSNFCFTSACRFVSTSGATPNGVSYVTSISQLTPEQLKTRHAQHILQEKNLSNHAKHYPKDKPFLAPKPSDCKKKVLVLDIDETLVVESCRRHHTIDTYDTKFPIDYGVYQFKYRPHARDFISMMDNMFEIVIFTAAIEVYGAGVMAALYPEKKFPLLSRGYCSGSAKDLSRLGRDLSQVALLDNQSYTYALQPRNAIPIFDFNGNLEDQYLKDIIPLMKALAEADHVYDVLDAFNSSHTPIVHPTASQAAAAAVPPVSS